MADVFVEPTWAIVELFGHNVIAGEVSSVTIAGTEMLRVDVPAVDEADGFTKFFGGAAIYAITPVDEATGRVAVEKFRTRPVDKWTLADPQLPARTEPGDYNDDEDELYDVG